jgi:hypothetical protein
MARMFSNIKKVNYLGWKETSLEFRTLAYSGWKRGRKGKRL